MKTLQKYTPAEELANALSHFTGALLALVGTFFMVRYSLTHGTQTHVIASLIFGGSMFLLFTFSGLTHSMPAGRGKIILSYLDQMSIFLMIAGTYTPFTLIALHGRTGWILFGIEWALAIIGIILKAFDKEGLEDQAKTIFIILYLIMGWLFLVSPSALYRAITIRGLLLIILAGVFYSVGIIFYRWQRLKFHHLIWHLFVLSAAIMFYFCIYFYVLPIKFH